jgi:hypothetical protein
MNKKQRPLWKKEKSTQQILEYDDNVFEGFDSLVGGKIYAG